MWVGLLACEGVEGKSREGHKGKRDDLEREEIGEREEERR